jgi:hypothetical protein
MHIIQFQIDKIENRPLLALSRLQSILLLNRGDDQVIDAVCRLINNSFHETILQTLIVDISTMRENVNITSNSILADVTAPKISMYHNLLIKNQQLKTIRRYEKAILTRLGTSPLDAAFSYLDMCMAVRDLTCVAANLTLSSIYFLELLEETNDPAQAYAFRNIINELSCQVFVLLRNRSAPHIQIYFFKLAFTLIVRANHKLRDRLTVKSYWYRREELITEQSQTILKELIKNIIENAKVSPFIQIPTSVSYDTLYLDAIGRRFLSKFFYDLSYNKEQKRQLFPNYTYKYYYFHGIWNRWIFHENFEMARFNCMESLLRYHQWSVQHVERLLKWSILPRTIDGWLLNETVPLNIDTVNSFLRVHGINFNFLTGDINFLFEEAKHTQYHYNHGLFDLNDVAEILTNGLTSAIFTLDHPNVAYRSHPFQEMRYAPANLSETNYLATLLHCDYLLKMLSTGSEVCAHSPFPIRPASHGFMKRLPERLRNALRPVWERKMYYPSHDKESAHRFWIEAGEITYEQDLTPMLRGEITFYLSDVKMVVKKQLMQTDEHGNFVDDTTNSNSSEHDSTPEGEFAAAFTKYYEEIGTYFPELLRLKELLKLGALLHIIRSIHKGLSCSLSTRTEEAISSSILRTIKRMGVSLEEDREFKLNNADDVCSWVPAVFCSDDKIRIYGGVNMPLILKEGNVRDSLRSSRNVNPFSPASHLRDAIENAKETHIKDIRIERVNALRLLETVKQKNYCTQGANNINYPNRISTTKQQSEIPNAIYDDIKGIA